MEVITKGDAVRVVGVETARAETAEGTNASAISTETARAEAAEAGALLTANLGAGVQTAAVNALNTNTGLSTTASLAKQRTTLLYDDFNRANTSAGVLTNPLKGAWTLLGNGAINAATSGQITNGQFVGTIGSVDYACSQLSNKPNRIEVPITFVTSTPASTNDVTFAFSVGTYENSSWINDMIHVIVTPTNCGIGTARNGWSAITYPPEATTTFDSRLPENVQIPVVFTLTGSTASLQVGDNKPVTLTSPEISRFHGDYFFIEHYYTPSTTDCKSTLAINSVYVATDSTIQAPDNNRTSRKSPAIGGASHLKFSSGSRATANLTGLTSIGVGDFSVYIRARIPDAYSLGSLVYGLWMLNSSSSGSSNGSGPILDYRNSSGFMLRAIIPSGANSLLNQYTSGPDFAQGKVTDLILTRRTDSTNGTEQRLYVNGIWYKVNSTSSTGTPPTWAQSITPSYFHVGTNGSNSWLDEIYLAGVANFALYNTDVPQVEAYGAEERFKWATNTALTTGSLTVGKCYHLGAVGTTNYYYTGCTVGDRIQVLTSTQARNLTNGILVTLSTTTINSSNPVTQDGWMVFLDGTTGNTASMLDQSSNNLNAPFTGTITVVGSRQKGTVTLASGTATVANTAVTANSFIAAFAQDNNTTGALRVVKTGGTGFTITSSNSADSGVVAWTMDN